MASLPAGATDQQTLPGFGIPSNPFALEGKDASANPAFYLLFLAVFPEPEDAQRIAAKAARWRALHDLSGEPLKPDRLHVTLHALARCSATLAVPQLLIDAARSAAGSVVCPAMPLVFDRALSFVRKGAKSPFVLRSDAAGDEAIGRLRGMLHPALRRVGLRPQASATPHMTLLYDARHVPEHGIEPLRWTAMRYALILSHAGAGHHQWVDQWPLRGD